MNKNIILCGGGGQGRILASRIIADAALKKDIPVKTAETIGMAQRGGSVFSHLRMGEAAGPMIAPGQADLIMGFEPAEAVRLLPYLKKDGAAVVSARPILPVSAMIGEAPYPVEEILAYLRAQVERLTLIDTEKALAELGSDKVLNVVLLGAAARSGELGLTEEELRAAVHSRLPERLHEVNDRALAYTGTAR